MPENKKTKQDHKEQHKITAIDNKNYKSIQKKAHQYTRTKLLYTNY